METNLSYLTLNAQATSRRQIEEQLEHLHSLTPITPRVAASEPESLRQELADQQELNLPVAADFDNLMWRKRQETEARRSGSVESRKSD